jgi:predicted nucleic acid-binding protein
MSEAGIVLDASVGIKLFIDEPFSDAAHDLFARLAGGSLPRVAVPDLFYVECANILWKAIRRLGMSAADARVFVSQLGMLALEVTPTSDLAVEALEIALTYGITAYDGVYVALSAYLGLPLITVDQPLIDALAGSPYRALHLATLAADTSG